MLCDIYPMAQTIIKIDNVILIISGMESIVILGNDAYLLDGDYHEKIDLADLD